MSVIVSVAAYAKARMDYPAVLRATPLLTGSGGGGPQPVPVASALKGGTIGVAYTLTFTAQGGVPPDTFTVTLGALPTGLGMSSSGSVTGTPTVAGTFSFTIRATDSLGATNSGSFTITIALPSSGGGGSAYTFIM